MERDQRIISETQRINMARDGRRRAEKGKALPYEILLEIGKPDAMREYLSGYMTIVERTLYEDGIEDPMTLGIHESYMHIVVQDDSLSGISGMMGVSDGTRAYRKNQQILDTSETDKNKILSRFNHYNDGYKIGRAFSNALLKKGNFEALPARKDIDPTLEKEILGNIQHWIDHKNVKNVMHELILNFHPSARLGCSFAINNPQMDIQNYLNDIRIRRISSKTPISDIEDEARNIMSGYQFGKRRMGLSE